MSKIETYFNSEINQRKLCSKKLSKCLEAFDFIDKVLIVLSATTRGVCIVYHATVVGAPVGVVSAGFTVVFFLTTGIIKKLLSITKSKKKKHDKILMLAKSKLNSIETLITQALIDIEISHEEFITILNEKENERKRQKHKWKKPWKYKLNNVNSRP